MDTLEPRLRAQVEKSIEDCLDNRDRPGAAEPLKGWRGYFRLRSGDWRVVFFWETIGPGESDRRMWVEKVAHRREVYRR